MSSKSIFADLHPERLLPSLTAGVISAITILSVEISLAALIFSGPLVPFVGRGIGFILFGTFAILFIGALTSSIPGTISVPQDSPAAILALMAAGIASVMPAPATPDAVFTTVVAAIILTSLIAGTFFLIFGYFKLSSFVRFIPYPVVGGFLAGTGWLLVKGSFGVMTGLSLNIDSLGQFIQPANLIHWLPGLVFAVALLLVLRRSSHFLVIPGTLALGIALFYAALALAGISISQAASQGWLLGSFDQTVSWQPILPGSLSLVNWSAILLQVNKIGAVLVLSLISLLLNTSALEVTVKEDIDLNRELQSAGVANLIAGIFGSPVGFPALSLSALAYRLNAKTRLVGVITALVCGATLFLGASLLSYFPKPILGGVLLFLGLSFLMEWVVDARTRLPRMDYLLVLLILVVIASIGFLEGIGVGVLAAIILFVVSYSRINAVKNVLSGTTYHSKVERPLAHREFLKEKGEEIFILRLQGFIFFGTAQKLLDRIRERVNDTQAPKLQFIVIDFRQVALLDSSAVFSITRMKQLAESQHIHMVWTDVSPVIQHQLEKGGLVDKTDDSFIILPSLDHGLEWCENQILASQGITNLTGIIEKVDGLLKHAFPNLQGVDRLLKYLEKKSINAGEIIMKQGNVSREMYFIEAGLVTAQLELPNGKNLRLRSMRGGTTVGEIGLYLGGAHTASVLAERPSTVYRLSGEALKEMEQNDPELAAILHQWIARLLAERLADNNRTLEALLD